MPETFSEDAVPLSDLKSILLTSVVQGLEDYEKTAEELQFVKAVAAGLMDVHDGNTVSLEEAKQTLGIK